MRFVVAAGGTGSRLLPATLSTNKHLIPCDKQTLMIDYPLRMFRKYGADEVIVVTGANHASQIVDYVGDGSRYEYKRVEYAFQPHPKGISDVIKRVMHHKNMGGVFMVLGDNYFEKMQAVDFYLNRAAAFQYDIGSLEQAKSFGQITYCPIDWTKPVDIIEKPTNPNHSKILTGLYYFPEDVFDLVEKLSPSKRNELEITDLLRLYLEQGRLDVHDVVGEWADLGEWSSLQKFWKSRS